MKALRACSVLVVLALCLTALVGCAPPYTGPPGTGTTVADKVYTITQPRVGELIFTTNPLAPPSLFDRIGTSPGYDPALNYRKLGSEDKSEPANSLILTFKDDSVLKFRPGPDGKTLGTVVIVRH